MTIWGKILQIYAEVGPMNLMCKEKFADQWQLKKNTHIIASQ